MSENSWVTANAFASSASAGSSAVMLRCLPSSSSCARLSSMSGEATGSASGPLMSLLRYSVIDDA